jgi:hypothetical protein
MIGICLVATDAWAFRPGLLGIAVPSGSGEEGYPFAAHRVAEYDFSVHVAAATDHCRNNDGWLDQ